MEFSSTQRDSGISPCGFNFTINFYSLLGSFFTCAFDVKIFYFRLFPIVAFFSSFVIWGQNVMCSLVSRWKRNSRSSLLILLIAISLVTPLAGSIDAIATTCITIRKKIVSFASKARQRKWSGRSFSVTLFIHSTAPWCLIRRRPIISARNTKQLNFLYAIIWGSVRSLYI